jgi:hypothetical protein
MQEVVKQLHQPRHQITGQAGTYEDAVVCSLMSKSKWRKETSKAINVAPTVRTLATDCNEGYSLTSPDVGNDAQYSQLLDTTATSFDDCVAKMKAAPQCAQAMAITYDGYNYVSRCRCFSFYSGAMVDPRYKSCVLMDKFKGDDPAFRNWNKEYRDGRQCLPMPCQKTKRQQEIAGRPSWALR